MSDATPIRVDDAVGLVSSTIHPLSAIAEAGVESSSPSTGAASATRTRIDASDPSASDSGIFRPPVGNYRSIEHGW